MGCSGLKSTWLLHWHPNNPQIFKLSCDYVIFSATWSCGPNKAEEKRKKKTPWTELFLMHDVMLDALQAGYAEMSEQQEGVVQAGRLLEAMGFAFCCVWGEATPDSVHKSHILVLMCIEWYVQKARITLLSPCTLGARSALRDWENKQQIFSTDSHNNDLCTAARKWKWDNRLFCCWRTVRLPGIKKNV